MRGRAFDPMQLDIEKFIFHVVHHGDSEPVLLDDTPIEGFEVFFKKRIFEILEGNRFEFLPNSEFLAAIKKIDGDDGVFIDVSKELASKFHSHQDARIKPGVMILTRIRFQGSTKYIFIKYDHEEVITYHRDGNKALLKEIGNTFSKSKESLQKSVIVDKEGDFSAVHIIDKSEAAHITKFFKGFLGVTRKYNEQSLTEKVRDAFLATVKKNRTILPKEFTSSATTTFYNIVQAREEFEFDQFLNEAFGTNNTESIRRDFQKELKQKDVSGETFKYNKNIKKPPKTRLQTQEGVSIQYPETADDTVEIKHYNSKTVIKITTVKLHEEPTKS
ncbi:MAG: hypothetical protein EON98_00280 [Chitinophagaceae bacterium]|nr:MAG: hypothetical protein EON98_00280 [Chitinophagaceae bacterium]